LRLKNFH